MKWKPISPIGIHPLSYLGVPRLYGVVLAMLFLNIYFNLFGLLGSYLVASFIHDIPFSDYIYNLIQALTGRGYPFGLSEKHSFRNHHCGRLHILWF